MNDTIKNGTTDKPPVSAIIEACRLHYGDRHKRVFDVVEQFLVDYLRDDRSEAVFLEICVRAEPKAVKALNNRKDAKKFTIGFILLTKRLPSGSWTSMLTLWRYGT